MGTSDGAVFQFRAIFPDKKWLSVAFPCCTCATAAQHVPEDFPAPQCPAWEPFRGSSSSPRNQKSHRVFLRPPCCTFLVVMCLSVPLSAIQTFPLFLSFGIFFVCPSVAFWLLGPGLWWDGRCPWPWRLIPSLVFSAGSMSSREVLPRGRRSPMKYSPQLQPSTFQRGEQTGWRCLPHSP